MADRLAAALHRGGLIPRNQWADKIGIGGRISPEYARKGSLRPELTDLTDLTSPSASTVALFTFVPPGVNSVNSVNSERGGGLSGHLKPAAHSCTQRAGLTT